MSLLSRWVAWSSIENRAEVAFHGLGRVTVGGATETGWIRLEVRDTGRGVEPELLPHIFDRFVTGDDSRGSGLGLAIARQLVVAHGGEIAAESVPGTGTTIRVRLPLTGD